MSRNSIDEYLTIIVTIVSSIPPWDFNLACLKKTRRLQEVERNEAQQRD